MARRKTNKRSKRQSTTARAATSSTALVKMEKSFHQIPAKLATLLNKEVTSLKKKQHKLKGAIDKISLQIKKSEKRLATVLKVKGATGKKQVKIAQKKLNDTLKTQQALHQQWEKSTFSLDNAVKMHSKFIALNKHLDSFEKEWTKQSKPAKVAKERSPAKKSASTKVSSAINEVTKGTIEPTSEPIRNQSNFDEIETSEMTS